MNKNKIIATIVTYNRLEFLKIIIEAIKNQTFPPEAILVVNNNSTDGTTQWLSEQKDLIVINQENVGSSGGQHTAFKYAYESGYNWIWTMDDDVLPEKNCLEILLQYANENIIQAPLRYTKENQPFLVDTKNFNLKNPFKSLWKEIVSEQDLNTVLIKATGITFEGPLIHRSVLEKIGFPNKDFFIYADDSEYFIRAQKAGFEIYLNTKAKLQRLLPYKIELSSKDWKFYYYIRNIIIIDVLHSTKLVRIIRPILYFFKTLMKCKNFSMLKTLFKAFKDGYFYKITEKAPYKDK